MVQPTAPATLALPEYGVQLNIPGPVQQKTFQARLQVVEPEALPVPPDGEVLRAVQIDLFDVDCKPIQDVRFWFLSELSITLTEAEIQRMGGASAVFNQGAQGRLRIERLEMSPTGGSWTAIATSFEPAQRAFSASLRYFSTYALVWSGPCLPWSALASGRRSSSESYTIISSVGQGQAIGLSSGQNTVQGAGFLYGVAGVRGALPQVIQRAFNDTVGVTGQATMGLTAAIRGAFRELVDLRDTVATHLARILHRASRTFVDGLPPVDIPLAGTVGQATGLEATADTVRVEQTTLTPAFCDAVLARGPPAVAPMDI